MRWYRTAAAGDDPSLVQRGAEAVEVLRLRV
jgi:hypothetical protein